MKTYHIYYSYKELPKIWDSIVKHDIFLQRHYLKALENASPDNIQLFYVGVFNDNELVGVAIIQRVQLYLKDMFRQTKVSCFKEFFRAMVSKVVKGNMLVVGNLTHTGQHGVFFQSDKITQAEYLNTVYEAIEALKKNIKQNQHKNIRAIMFKDYYEDNLIHNEQGFFNTYKLHKVSVQPNMAMPIKPSWVLNDDYIKDFNKKYRDRYKRAKKKLGAIKLIELDTITVKTESKSLYKLYLNVSNNAKFNTFFLPENHFYSLKLELKDRFKVYGYFLNEELVGFYSLILNGKNLETYFLGYDTEHQYPNQLYLNMLYDMANFAIDNKFENVVYARTAMEIKSSVGATPKQMVVYVKHTNKFINSILKQLFKLMDPTQKWEARHPFKD
ncbi:GNAT family protein [Confluentibacter flavum]|uniref:GNAT family N-acetyltransferase n=1 Tax=Confluentibacter flavum TaxID=1909700 RepID=UPI001EEF8184|nr:GNAT family N-acetyltransferase [Confluentibacter flavum]